MCTIPPSACGALDTTAASYLYCFSFLFSEKVGVTCTYTVICLCTCTLLCCGLSLRHIYCTIDQTMQICFASDRSVFTKRKEHLSQCPNLADAWRKPFSRFSFCRKCKCRTFTATFAIIIFNSLILPIWVLRVNCKKCDLAVAGLPRRLPSPCCSVTIWKGPLKSRGLHDWSNGDMKKMPAYTGVLVIVGGLTLVKVLPLGSVARSFARSVVAVDLYCLSAVPSALFNRRYMTLYTLPRLSLGRQ